MQVLSVDEARSWCAGHDFPIADYPHWSDPRLKRGISYATADRHSTSQALVRCVAGNAAAGETIVWISDWPLYHPDEMAVITRFRASADERRPLIDAPAHIFDDAEIDDCVGCFNLCDQYRWDALLFVPASGLIVFNSHDEIQYLMWLRESDNADLRAIVKRHGLAIVE
jgi:hypothetical protein